MMSKIEQYEARRQRIMRHYLAGFVIWGSALAVIFLGLDWLRRDVMTAVVLIGLVGWVYWTVYLVQFIRLGRELRGDPATAAALNDEFTRAAQMQALQAAFWAVMVVQGVLVLLVTFDVPMSPMFSPIATIVVGVVTALGYGLRLEQG